MLKAVLRDGNEEKSTGTKNVDANSNIERWLGRSDICDLCQKNKDYVPKMKNMFYCINKYNTSQASI
jgi:hypothetical protein